MGAFFVKKNPKNNDFEENRSNKWFVECSVFFTSADPLMLRLICIK